MRQYGSHSNYALFHCQRNNAKLVNLPKFTVLQLKWLGAISRRQLGRPKKHEGGWESTNKRICIANEMFGKWRRLRDKLNLVNDDAMARFLLATAEQASKEQTGGARNQLDRERLVKLIPVNI